jgi:hypothetical protein
MGASDTPGMAFSTFAGAIGLGSNDNASGGGGALAESASNKVNINTLHVRRDLRDSPGIIS